jgi:hypothetical protein
MYIYQMLRFSVLDPTNHENGEINDVIFLSVYDAVSIAMWPQRKYFAYTSWTPTDMAS